MRLLSWDVGIINLAYCLLETVDNTMTIIKWDVINLLDHPTCTQCTAKATYSRGKSPFCNTHKGEGAKKLTNGSNVDLDIIKQKLVELLDKESSFLTADTVIIENQPCMKNPKMKSIACCLYDYFLIRGKIDKKTVETIRFISASNKLKLANDGGDISTYALRKKAAKTICHNMIGGNPEYAAIFGSHKKKDDLADCLLQAVVFLKKEGLDCSLT